MNAPTRSSKGGVDIIDEVTLHGDEDLVEQLARLETMGVRLSEMKSPRTNTRTLILIDRVDRVLMTCLVRMEILDQVREMLDIYETSVLDPKATRH